MISISTLTPASTTPISVADLKARLRLNTTAEDDLLSDWIVAATDAWSKRTGYVPLSTGFRLQLDTWPVKNVISIPRSPVTAVTAVQYLDTAGSWQTVDPSNYSLDTALSIPRVVFGDNFIWPTTHAWEKPVVRVDFSAGHASAAAVPKMVTTYVSLLAAHYYEQRTAYATDDLKAVPVGLDYIAESYSLPILGDLWGQDHRGGYRTLNGGCR